MTLLHPWAAGLGIAAVALPVAIHLLTRPRPKRVPLSTIRFVRQAVQQKRARYRLRDFLVLLLRALAVGLFGWAFARPMLGAKPTHDSASPGSVVQVIILDDSMSMGAVSNGSTAFDRARSAAQYLKYQSGLRADLIIAGARPHAVFDRVSMNLGALHEALASASPQPESLDAQAAINLAAKILAAAPQSPDSRLELVIFSDFQRTSWASVDFSPVPKDAQIDLQSAAATPTPDNVAILRVGAKGRLEEGRPVQLEAEIGNFTSAARDVKVQIDLGSSTHYLQGRCSPNVKTTLSAMVTLPQTPGWLSGNAKLLGVTDSLIADNERPLTLQVRPLPVYALITSESAKPHASSSHYLERALVPSKPATGEMGETVERIDPKTLDRQATAAASLLVLDHPGELSDDTINYLATLVRRGRGLFYIAADPVDATNLGKLSKVLGADLKMPVELVPPTAARPRHDLFLMEWRKDQPPLDELNDTISAVAGTLRFSRGLDSRRLSGGLVDDILATYSDGSACLVITPAGAGTLAVLNTDLPASNLPSSPLFVPLIDELCGRLLAVTNSANTVPCGQPISVYLPEDAGASQGLKITGPPQSPTDLGAITDESTGVLWHADAAGPTGIYQVKRGDKTVFAIASAPPADESDLQSIDPKTLTTRLAAGRRISYQTAGELPPKDLAWAWLLVGCVACLVLELGVLKVFKS